MTFDQAIQTVSQFLRADEVDGDIAYDSIRLSFGQVNHYLRFLAMISDRNRGAVVEYEEAHLAMQSALRARHSDDSIDLRPFSERSQSAYWNLHLDVESFYLFAKIMLSKVTLAIVTYFGQARGIKFKSHDELSKNLEQFALRKGLVLEPSFLKTAIQLKREVVDYRDKRIEHLLDSTSYKALNFGGTASTVVLLTKGDQARESQQAPMQTLPITVLEESLCAYVELVLECLAANRDKCRLRQDSKFEKGN